MTDLSPRMIAACVYLTVGVSTFFVFLFCHLRIGPGERRLRWTLTMLRWMLYSPLLWPLLWPALFRYFSLQREAKDEHEPG